jgi:hypothetical protein
VTSNRQPSSFDHFSPRPSNWNRPNPQSTTWSEINETFHKKHKNKLTEAPSVVIVLNYHGVVLKFLKPYLKLPEADTYINWFQVVWRPGSEVTIQK